MTMNDITASRQLATEVMDRAYDAYQSFQQLSAVTRAQLLEKIAATLESRRAVLVPLARQETHLPEARLNGELSRTTGQLRLFADLLLEGSWVQASIDPALPERTPVPRTDIRSMLRPKGPVVVFGASNFPFAFSTVGGDTASALAAGCPVVVKAHPRHKATSEAVFKAASEAIRDLGLPEAILQHVDLPGYQIGKDLVQAAATAAVGFTGSFQGGQALMRAAAEREKPIEVFAEMSSINPVVVLPGLIKEQSKATAEKLAASIQLGVGQFCTSPGLIFVLQDDQSDTFKADLEASLSSQPGAAMLHEGIVANYHHNLQIVLSQPGVQELVTGKNNPEELLTAPSLASVTAERFLHNKALKTEVFGPFSLLVVANDQQELIEAVASVDGQLTASIFGSDKDLENTAMITPLLHQMTELAGRVIFNEVPTGVEVGHAMVHGGPFPATSYSGYTSVGAASVLRWVRPVCYQNVPDGLLPEALQNKNPLGIWRQIEGEWTKAPLSTN